MSIAKVTLRFDVLPEEKLDLEIICKSLGGITKIEFLRKAMREAKGEEDNLTSAWAKVIAERRAQGEESK